jgi:GT2 family glycosyltransferase
MASLSVSIVFYHSSLEDLRATVESLRDSLASARARGKLDHTALWLVDNGSDDMSLVDRVVNDAVGDAQWISLEVLRGQGNVGYGGGHDLAIKASRCDYHLVLNPDVTVSRPAIGEAIDYMEGNPSVGLLTPHVVNHEGERQYLCKRYPSVLVLLLRGFAPRRLRRRFEGLLHRYEMHDVPENQIRVGIPIATGCFMFTRSDTLLDLGGFSPKYFMYFEDFDLSLRLGRIADIAYVPQVHITHSGGGAAKKGWTHRRLFMRSALTFFRDHGWKLW